MRRLRLLAAALLTAGLVGAPLAADAATAPTPGNLTGYAFDSCQTPSQASMDAWLTTSPFWGVGIYLGGENRYQECESDQPALTRTWVSTQLAHGWRLLPIWVGPQAACTTYTGAKIDATPASSYAAAKLQGARAADAAADAASGLGVPSGSTLFYDLEDYALTDDDCRRSALSFLSGWTTEVHARAFRSGVYSNVSAAIASLDYADNVAHGSYVMPDQIWYAWENGKADTAIDTQWVRTSSWTPHKRSHQYDLDTDVTYGGVTLHIDRSFLDLGTGSVAPQAASTCGVNVNLGSYPTLRRGSTGSAVKAAQCLLKLQHYYGGTVSGRYDAATATAVKRLQTHAHLYASGTLGKGAWTALLAAGQHPLLKRGSASEPVRHLQRALNAAGGEGLGVNGVFGSGTSSAVRRYQQRVGQPVTGVVTWTTWSALLAGKV